MFDELTGKLERMVRNLRGQGKLTEANVRDTLRDVRRILLEADVSLPAVKAFIESAAIRALGQEVLASITPGQQMIKVIHDELAAFLGGEAEPVRFGKSPSPILLVGLNGAGKTTTAAKLALHLRKKGRKPLLVAADTHRPAAAEQLETLGRQLGIPVVHGDGPDPAQIYEKGREFARREGLDCIIVDSAGRMHIDDELMAELEHLQSVVKPPETLLVMDGMTGQDAVRSAQVFASRIEITGLVLTKLDGDARGGAALSLRFITGRPIKFVGMGEKTGDLEIFHPDRLAGRILGMGDVVSLVERAQASVDAESAAKLARKLIQREFTLDDFKEQILQLKKMGPLESILGMLPGMKGALKGVDVNEGEMKAVVAIIDSMTPNERRTPRIIDGSRRRRIARGSGRSVQEVNRLLNQFEQSQRMMKLLGRKRGLPGGLPPFGR
ncbi:MAG: signal recognition particle protein [Calditrichaeota bacterium]|nr:signal recognition particle protein [Calditrichota bacterium]